MKHILFSMFFLTLLQAQAQEDRAIPYSQGDRDRLTRLEIKVEMLDKKIDEKFAENNKRFDALEQTMRDSNQIIHNYIMALFLAIIGLVGFILWDRRSSISPVEKKQKQLIETLREYSTKNPEFAEIFNRAAIL